MIFYIFITFSVVTSVLYAAEEVRLLPINHCKQNSIDYFSCLKDTLEESWPEIVKGFPQIDLPCLDPFFYDYGKGVFHIGEIYGEVTMSNIIVTGFKNIHFLTVKSYLDNDSFHSEADLTLSKMIIDGDCNAVGSLGVIRLGGKGHFNATAEDIRVSVYIPGHIENDTLVIEHVRINPTMEKLKVHMSDFFEGNKELNDLFELFVNEYWPPFYRLLIPVLLEEVDKWGTNFFNRVFINLSVSQLFP